jgi:hypothetical protein
MGNDVAGGAGEIADEMSNQKFFLRLRKSLRLRVSAKARFDIGPVSEKYPSSEFPAAAFVTAGGTSSHGSRKNSFRRRVTTCQCLVPSAEKSKPNSNWPTDVDQFDRANRRFT